MRLAVYQCKSIGANPTARLESLRRAAAETAGSADVLVCPELFATGYNVGAATVRRLAEPVDGPFNTAAAAIARDNGLALVYGYAERAGDDVFNAAVCLDRDGRRLANHRKLYMSGAYEEAAFAVGRRYTAFDVCGVRCGLLICFDVEFPESVRAMRRAGCDVVIVPTALVDRWEYLTRTMVPTRAIENNLFLVYANYVGSEGGLTYCGNSVIVGPDGLDLARGGAEEERIDAPIDVDRARAARLVLPYLAKLSGATIDPAGA